MRRRTLLLACVLPLAVVGCESVTEPIACTAIAVSSLNVTVRDAATSARVCDATVTAVLAGVTYELRRAGSPDPAGCTYAGPEERAGVFEVRVSRPGYAAAVVPNVPGHRRRVPRDPGVVDGGPAPELVTSPAPAIVYRPTPVARHHCSGTPLVPERVGFKEELTVLF